MSDECIHGLGPVAACVICNGRAKREQAEAYRTFPAKYPGHCSACNLPIYVGQMIAWRQDEPVTHAEVGCIAPKRAMVVGHRPDG